MNIPSVTPYPARYWLRWSETREYPLGLLTQELRDAIDAGTERVPFRIIQCKESRHGRVVAAIENDVAVVVDNITGTRLTVAWADLHA